MTIGDFLRGRALRPNPPAYLSEDWCYELGRRLLRPERPRLTEALALHRALECDPLGGHERRAEDAAAAWERALNDGLLPASWAGDAARCFVVERLGAGHWPGHVRLVPTPRTAGDVVALASDVENVLRAEAAAAEWLARKAQFIDPYVRGDGTPEDAPDDGAEGTLWRVLPLDSRLPRTHAYLEDTGLIHKCVRLSEEERAALHGRDDEAFLRGVAESFPLAAASYRRFMRGLPAGGSEDLDAATLHAVSTWLHSSRIWREASKREIELWWSWNWTSLPPMARADQLRDPFQPLLDVVWLGYIPELSAQRRAVLSAPAVIPYCHLEPPEGDAPPRSDIVARHDDP